MHLDWKDHISSENKTHTHTQSTASMMGRFSNWRLNVKFTVFVWTCLCHSLHICPFRIFPQHTESIGSLSGLSSDLFLTLKILLKCSINHFKCHAYLGKKSNWFPMLFQKWNKLTIIWFGECLNLNKIWTLLFWWDWGGKNNIHTEAKRAINEIKQHFLNWHKPCFWMGSWHITRLF